MPPKPSRVETSAASLGSAGATAPMTPGPAGSPVATASSAGEAAPSAGAAASGAGGSTGHDAATKTVFIVGGGPASVVKLVNYAIGLESLSEFEKHKIIIAEKSDDVGPGNNYGKPRQDEFEHIINLPKDFMEKAIYSESKTFSEWLQEHESPEINKYSSAQFTPRWVFGQYLIWAREQAIAKLTSLGHEVVLKTKTSVTSVTSAQQAEGKVKYNVECTTLAIKSGEQHTARDTFTADSVILAVGHLPPEQYSTIKRDDFEQNPYNSSKPLRKDDTVGILGSGLTAIDAVLSLFFNGDGTLRPEGSRPKKVVLMSPSGRLPRVLNSNMSSYELIHFTPAALQSIIKSGPGTIDHTAIWSLFRQEFDEVLPGFNRLSVTELSAKAIIRLIHGEDTDEQSRLRANIALATSPKGDQCQNILFAMYRVLGMFWHQTPPEDQVQFITQFYSLFIKFLAAFPVENARRILELLDKKVLEIRGGVSTESLFTGGDHKLTVGYPDGTNESFDRMINATGSSVDPKQSPLLQQMIKAGLIQSSPNGGIAVNFGTQCAIDAKGKETNIGVLGVLNRSRTPVSADIGNVSGQAKAMLYKNLGIFPNPPYRQSTPTKGDTPFDWHRFLPTANLLLAGMGLAAGLYTSLLAVRSHGSTDDTYNFTNSTISTIFAAQGFGYGPNTGDAAAYEPPGR